MLGIQHGQAEGDQFIRNRSLDHAEPVYGAPVTMQCSFPSLA